MRTKQEGSENSTTLLEIDLALYMLFLYTGALKLGIWIKELVCRLENGEIRSWLGRKSLDLKQTPIFS